MIVAVGHKLKKPPERVKVLLGGPLMTQSSIFGIQGFMRFQIQDLKAYRTDDGGILPVIGMDEIKWHLDGELLIGEVS